MMRPRTGKNAGGSVEVVYAANGRGLGDRWASVSFCIAQAICESRPIKMAPRYFHARKNVWRQYDLSFVQYFVGGDLLEIVDFPPSRQLNWQEVFHRTPYQPTKRRWIPNASGTVCYQFDGKSWHRQNFRTPDEEFLIIREIERLGWQAVRLGKEISQDSLSADIDRLANCEFFVGVDSGLSHVAYSVGTPILMVVNGRGPQIWDSQGERRLIVARDHLDTVRKLTAWRDRGASYYEQEAVFLDAAGAAKLDAGADYWKRRPAWWGERMRQLEAQGLPDDCKP